MKQVFRQVVVWAVFAVISSFGAFAQQHVHIVGHRGFWKAESAAGTQNSIASLRAAEAESLWGSEFDVQLTKDGIPIVNHDPTIPSGAQKLRIDEYTWKELSKLNLANGEKRPTLDSYIAEGAKLSNTRLVVELKRQREPDGGHAREEKLLSETVSILKKYGVFTPERVVFISFSLYICEQIAERYPSFTNQYLEGDLTPAEVKAKGINGIDYKYKVFKKHPEWVAEAKELGLSVNTWTVDKEEDILQMIDLGVEYITSDEPLLVRKLLNKRGVFQVEASDLSASCAPIRRIFTIAWIRWPIPGSTRARSAEPGCPPALWSLSAPIQSGSRSRPTMSTVKKRSNLPRSCTAVMICISRRMANGSGPGPA